MEKASFLSSLWKKSKVVFRAIFVARISILMVLISFIIFFCISQGRDAIIALGNFGSINHFVIVSIAGLIWAFLVWYLARVFYYIIFFKREVKEPECFIVKNTPRLLGGLSLLIMGLSFIRESLRIGPQGYGKWPLFFIGLVFLVIMLLFLIFVYLRRKIFDLDIKMLCRKNFEGEGIFPFTSLPPVTRTILLISLIVSICFLILLLASPNYITPVLGDAITIILFCLCTWIAILYLIYYWSKRFKLPLFRVIMLLIALFSLFNGNKNIRLTDGVVNREWNLTEYFEEWCKKRSEQYRKSERPPMIMIISEGGGIRAAYWSAGLLSRMQEEYPIFSKYVFAINGVSGGSFGAAIYTSLLQFYIEYPKQYRKGVMREKAKEIIGKDFLSPVIASTLSHDIVQSILPFPVSSFDQAKVFEKSWEMEWEKAMSHEAEDQLHVDKRFGIPISRLWENNDDFIIPALFLNTCRVENGMPVTISNIKLYEDGTAAAKLGIIQDFYYFSSGKDLRISTAAYLSARFPYIGPAGTLINYGETAGFVDGGYYDNTGAATAFEILVKLKKEMAKARGGSCYSNSIFMERIKPVVIYIKNGSTTKDARNSGRTMFYQITVPFDTLFQTRDAHSENALQRLKDFVEMNGGEYIVYSLDSGAKPRTEYPMGWALSKTVQEEIDRNIEAIELSALERLLP